MKKKKSFLLFTGIFALLITFIFVIKNNQNSSSSSKTENINSRVKSLNGIATLKFLELQSNVSLNSSSRWGCNPESMFENSALVVVGSPTSKFVNREYKYEFKEYKSLDNHILEDRYQYTKTEIKVKEVLKGGVQKNDTIQIAEGYASIVPFDSKNLDKFVLYSDEGYVPSKKGLDYVFFLYQPKEKTDFEYSVICPEGKVNIDGRDLSENKFNYDESANFIGKTRMYEFLSKYIKNLPELKSVGKSTPFTKKVSFEDFDISEEELKLAGNIYLSGGNENGEIVENVSSEEATIEK